MQVSLVFRSFDIYSKELRWFSSFKAVGRPEPWRKKFLPVGGTVTDNEQWMAGDIFPERVAVVGYNLSRSMALWELKVDNGPHGQGFGQLRAWL